MARKIITLVLLLIASDIAVALNPSCAESVRNIISGAIHGLTGMGDSDSDDEGVFASDDDDDDARPSSVLLYEDEEAKRAAAIARTSVTMLESIIGSFLIYRFGEASSWEIMVGQHSRELGVSLGAGRAYNMSYADGIYKVSRVMSPGVKFIVGGLHYRGIALWHEGEGRALVGELELYSGSFRQLSAAEISVLFRGEGCSAEVVLALKAVIFAGYHQ